MSKVTAIALANDYSSLLNLLETSDELTPEMIADTWKGLKVNWLIVLMLLWWWRAITWATRKPAKKK